MVDKWRTMTLSQAGVSLIDCDHRTPPASDTGYPYIAIPQIKQGRLELSAVRRISRNHFVQWTRKANPQTFDVILSRRCNPGETAFVPPGFEGALGQNLVLLRADESKVFRPFLRWLVRSPFWWEQVRKFINVGAVFDSLRCADVPNFELPIPPLQEQKAIAQILGTLDDKIELNRRMNETLEAMARTIFTSWFVDFDPVRAKADGRKPAGMDAETAALFPDSFEDSPLGKVPKGWRPATFSDIAELNRWTLSKKEHLDPVEYVEISEVLRGSIQTVAVYPRGKEPSRARRRLRHGDTVLSTVRPDRGSYFLCLNPSPNLVASTGFAVLTPKQAPWTFVYLALARQENLDELGRLADGGAYPAVRPEVVAGLDLVLPNREQLLSVFHQTCESMMQKAESNRRESRHLVSIRDALLPKLLSGEIHVGKSAHCVAEASA